MMGCSALRCFSNEMTGLYLWNIPNNADLGSKEQLQPEPLLRKAGPWWPLSHFTSGRGSCCRVRDTWPCLLTELLSPPLTLPSLLGLKNSFGMMKYRLFVGITAGKSLNSMTDFQSGPGRLCRGHQAGCRTVEEETGKGTSVLEAVSGGEGHVRER